MHALALDGLLLALLALAFFGRKEMRAFAKDFFTVGEDLWTWSTSAGDLYEDVELQEVADGEVVIRHRYGTSRLAIDLLSEKTHDLLFRTRQWREHVSAEPSEGKITSFISSSHAQAA